ncbi:MAG: Uma2 family endonuclease, partial [Nocardioidaceae bacterium]
VISPTSRLRDANLKKAVYARMGVVSYWLVDPNRDEPTITAFTLAGADYEQVAHVVGDEPFAATDPFAVYVVPRDLVAGLHR